MKLFWEITFLATFWEVLLQSEFLLAIKFATTSRNKKILPFLQPDCLKTSHFRKNKCKKRLFLFNKYSRLVFLFKGKWSTCFRLFHVRFVLDQHPDGILAGVSGYFPSGIAILNLGKFEVKADLNWFNI